MGSSLLREFYISFYDGNTFVNERRRHMAKNLTNKTWHGIYYSEFIAAWNNTTLEGITPLFKDWLLQLEYNGDKMPISVVAEIMDLATVTVPGLEKCSESFIKSAYEMVIIKSAEGGN